MIISSEFILFYFEVFLSLFVCFLFKIYYELFMKKKKKNVRIV